MLKIMSWTKHFFNYFVLVLVMVAFVELASFCIAVFFVNNIYSHSETIFENVSFKNHRLLGWVEKYGAENPRPSAITIERRADKDYCVYIFGDSFAHADEVSHEAAWSNVLEKKLGCNVANFGVGGYGSDQAYLRLSELLPSRAVDNRSRPKIVLFGIYQEMLRRNMAASWLFYCCPERKTSLKPYYKFNKTNQTITLEPIPIQAGIEEVRRHHREDKYYQLSKVEFPYTLGIMKAALYRLNKRAFDILVIQGWRAYAKEDVVRKQYLIMGKVIDLALSRGYTPIFLVFPNTYDAARNKKRYAQFLRDIPFKDDVDRPFDIIDLLGPLHAISKEKNRELRAPGGHYNSLANKVIGEHLHKSIGKKLTF